MTRSPIGLILALAFSLFAAPLAADAQQMKKVPRVGMRSVGSPPSLPDWKQQSFFWQELRNLGWMDDQNIIVEYRWASRRSARLADLAAEFVRFNVDVIVVPDTLAIPAPKPATTTIPLVMLAAADPVAWGYVASLARPGGNITGISGQSQELSGKLLGLLNEAVPQVTRVAVLAAPRPPDIKQLLREMEAAAQALGVQPHVLEVRGAHEFERAFETATREGAGALLILPGLLCSLHERQLAALAVKSRLPAICSHRSCAEHGGLMAYGPSAAAWWHRATALVDKILKGAKPADLPVEQVTACELVINLKTAQALGLTIPPTLPRSGRGGDPLTLPGSHHNACGGSSVSRLHAPRTSRMC